MQPQTRYARSGSVHIAYQVVGDGPVDLVLVPGFISHAEPGEVLVSSTVKAPVSSTVKALVAGSGLAFEDRGTHQLKGVPDEWSLYRLVSCPASSRS